MAHKKTHTRKFLAALVIIYQKLETKMSISRLDKQMDIFIQWNTIQPKKKGRREKKMN